MRKATVAVIGAKHPHSSSFLTTLKSLDNVERLVLVEPDGAAAVAAGVETIHANVGAMLNTERPDATFIMLPTDEVEPVALECIAAGSHIFIEKHGTHTAAACRRIVEASRQAGLIFSMGYLWRSHPISRDIKRFITEGVIGTPWAWEFRMVTTSVAARIGGNPWLFEKARSGGGILVWLGCHYIDLMRYLLDADVTEVSAMTATQTSEKTDVEDVASVSLKMSNGMIGTIHAGYVMPRGLKEGYDSLITIRGSEGDIRWEPATEQTLKVRSVAPSWRATPAAAFNYTMREMPGYGGAHGHDFFHAYVDCVLQGKDHIVTGEDALKVLEICEAAYESAQMGRHVKL
jgi:predicted dehydrogenase